MWYKCAMQEIRTPPPLRERQAEAIRASILAALIARLEHQALDDISMDELARDAGVSRRTLYRYFPSRAALLAAAEEVIVARLGLRMAIDGPDGISARFRASSYRLEEEPGLARALRQTTAGQDLRPPLRARRLESIVAALEPLTADLDPDEARRVEAVIAYLCSANAWVTIRDESGLPGEEIRAAVTWAIETLLADVRRRGAARQAADAGDA